MELPLIGFRAFSATQRKVWAPAIGRGVLGLPWPTISVSCISLLSCNIHVTSAQFSRSRPEFDGAPLPLPQEKPWWIVVHTPAPSPPRRPTYR